MERWNGWGDESRRVAVPTRLRALLVSELGPTAPPADATLEQVLRRVPPSRLAAQGSSSADASTRLRNARGQGFADLVALRSGVVGPVPDAVARPTSAPEVQRLLQQAARDRTVVIARGGGTSVVGAVTVVESDRPVLVVDLRRLRRLRHVDHVSGLATVEAGAVGPQVDGQLRLHGLTLGHVPQSYERSTVGGWVATRSSGQQSLGYGRIEDLFAGGRLESPAGTLVLPPFPASAAGPDLRHSVLGSEGRLGVLTEATLRVRSLPEVDEVVAAFLPDWDAALPALRTLARDSAGLSLLRLSSPEETRTSLLLAGHAGRVVDAGLSAVGLPPGRCLLLAGVTGTAVRARQARRALARVVREHGGVTTGTPLGRHWQRSRFAGPYLRDALWEEGYGADTVETATTWAQVPALVRALEAALRSALDEPVHVGTHLSHVYRSGSSIYTTFVFRRGPDASATLDRWGRLRAAALSAITGGGGTVTHQHGVGLDHRQHAAAEKGPLGTAALQSLVRVFDPDGMLNPGKLLP